MYRTLIISAFFNATLYAKYVSKLLFPETVLAYLGNLLMISFVWNSLNLFIRYREATNEPKKKGRKKEKLRFHDGDVLDFNVSPLE